MSLLKSGARLVLLLACGGGLSSCYDDWYGNNFINWYVDPVFGSNVYGNGSPYYPFKTIGQALQVSIPGDGVILAPGTYSATNGEVFPLLVKPGVAILGDPSTRGSSTSVIGGGSYTIQGGLQIGNIITTAFVMGSGSQLSGVKVTVAGAAGVGVVFDGNSGSLISCTLTSCGASGVRVYEAASPTITDNVISNNGGTGVTLFDTASPNLRQNQILNNATDGILANDTSNPNLGDGVTAGANTIQGNTGVGLNNATTASTLSAVGNTWALMVLQGSDASGQYPTHPLVSGPTGGAPGDNFSITNAAAKIQF